MRQSMDIYHDLFDLDGQIALVTGSSRGLGLFFARTLAQAGAKVVLNGRNEEALEEARRSLEQEGLEVQSAVFDVTDEPAIQQAVRKIERESGPVTILVNNAGVQIRGPLEHFSTGDWRTVLDVNVTGAFLVARAVVQGMIQARHGKIVNICSVQSELARPTIAPYTASKGALKMLTRAMATEWARYNIQVNGLAPGYFKTEMTRPLYEDERFDAWLRSRVPAGRWGEPEELAGALLFLASKASDYVSGHVLFVDGGLAVCV